MEKKTQKSKAMKQLTIHEKAIRLIEGGQVDVDGHCVRLKISSEWWDVCFLCEMDCLCTAGSEMDSVCQECDNITQKHCYLELVTNDNEVKQ